VQRLATDAKAGLDTAEVARRAERYGPNRLHAAGAPTFVGIFFEEIREPMILLLIGTGILYAVWGQPADAITIFGVIAALVAAEVFTEYRAKHAISALSTLAEPESIVVRDGRACEVSVESLVPGDIIVISAGHRVPADARLLEEYGVGVDESTLTGESAVVRKDAGALLAAATPLAERVNMLYAGTMVSGGHGTAAVVATGAQSELGRLAALAQEVKPPRTPLQQMMANLSLWLAWFALGISILVPLLGWALNHQSPRTMILTGLSLAFSMIPEELPIIVTMVLGLGAWRLARLHAIVKRLPAVETLGAVTVIATDKTGTLTENQTEVVQFDPLDRRRRMLEIGALCNDALESGEAFVGDPLETALLRAARADGIDLASLRDETIVREEFSFDNARKRMSVVWQARAGGASRVAMKGAPEAVLAASVLDETEQAGVRAAAARMASQGMRVLALAEGTLEQDAGATQEAVERELTFVGLAAFADPPRPEVKGAIAACRGAGIRTIILTGDHALTAAAIAESVGLDARGHTLSGSDIDALSDEALSDALDTTAVVARVTPRHKLRIVRSLQSRGERVAVTGDGSNDAPALAAADIGVAMGEKGTDIARDAASLVLADDNFATIVNAIHEGRTLFDNLRKGVRYYLACKVALAASVLLPVLLRAPVPFAPIQIILMELFMDLAASAAFVAEPAESDVMRRPPRDPHTPFMNRGMVSGIFSASFGLFAAVSVAYLVTWFGGAGLVRAQTMAFVTWLFGHVFLALTMRSGNDPLMKRGLFSNRVMTAWAAVTIAFVIAVTFVAPVQQDLKATALHAADFGLAIGLAFAGTFWAEVPKALRALNAR